MFDVEGPSLIIPKTLENLKFVLISLEGNFPLDLSKYKQKQFLHWHKDSKYTILFYTLYEAKVL